MLCPTWLAVAIPSAVTNLSSTPSSTPTSTSWNLQQQESHHQLHLIAVSQSLARVNKMIGLGSDKIDPKVLPPF